MVARAVGAVNGAGDVRLTWAVQYDSPGRVGYMADGPQPDGPQERRDDPLADYVVAELGRLRIAVRSLLTVVRPADENEQRIVDEARACLEEKSKAAPKDDS